MSSTQDNGLGVVADGARRLRSDERLQITREVEAAYAHRLNDARWWQRWCLYAVIRREIRRRCRKAAPAGGLYVVSPGKHR